MKDIFKQIIIQFLPDETDILFHKIHKSNTRFFITEFPYVGGMKEILYLKEMKSFRIL